jgi:hypothetical protein
MKVGGDAAFLDLFELPTDVELRLQSRAPRRERLAEISLSTRYLSVPPFQAARVPNIRGKWKRKRKASLRNFCTQGGRCRDR